MQGNLLLKMAIEKNGTPCDQNIKDEFKTLHKNNKKTTSKYVFFLKLYLLFKICKCITSYKQNWQTVLILHVHEHYNNLAV